MACAGRSDLGHGWGILDVEARNEKEEAAAHVNRAMYPSKGASGEWNAMRGCLSFVWDVCSRRENADERQSSFTMLASRNKSREVAVSQSA